MIKWGSIRCKHFVWWKHIYQIKCWLFQIFKFKHYNLHPGQVLLPVCRQSLLFGLHWVMFSTVPLGKDHLGSKWILVLKCMSPCLIQQQLDDSRSFKSTLMTRLKNFEFPYQASIFLSEVMTKKLLLVVPDLWRWWLRHVQEELDPLGGDRRPQDVDGVVGGLEEERRRRETLPELFPS